MQVKERKVILTPFNPDAPVAQDSRHKERKNLDPEKKQMHFSVFLEKFLLSGLDCTS